MSEEQVILQEYFEGLGFNNKEVLTQEDLRDLRNELKEAGELALANWVASLGSPEELLEYVKEEQ